MIKTHVNADIERALQYNHNLVKTIMEVFPSIVQQGNAYFI